MKKLQLVFIVFLAVILSACASAPQQKWAAPHQLTAPIPTEGNSGEFMSPYTTDGVLTEWVDKAVNAKMGSAVGGAAGAYAGRKLAENVPLFGSMIGKKIGDKLGREVAIKMSGGEEFIRESSDVSFASLEDMAVWMYVNHSSHAHFQDALKSTWEIYPDFQQIYPVAIANASANAGY